MESPALARQRILALVEPGEAIEVPLSDAVGLCLAEDVVADVDMPADDRAAIDGYAARSSEASLGTLLRVAEPGSVNEPHFDVEPGEAARVRRGRTLPVGADLVLAYHDVRPDPDSDAPRVVELLRRSGPGAGVIPRGDQLRLGDVVARKGERIRPAMAPLLASQGCVHPICRRRARVAVLAVGDNLVGPNEAPVLHRERNAANLGVTVLCLRTGATVYDLGAVAESNLGPSLDRALSASVTLLLGESSGRMLRAMARAGIEPIVSGVNLQPGGAVQYGVIRNEQRRVIQHVFHLESDPISAIVGVAYFVLPLIDRIHGGSAESSPILNALWEGESLGTSDRGRAVPVSLRMSRDARLLARPVPLQAQDDLIGFAKADGLALIPGGTGSESLVEVAPLSPWGG